MRIEVSATIVNQASGAGVVDITLFHDGFEPYVEIVAKRPEPGSLPKIESYRRVKASQFVAVARAIIAATGG